jgi:hypothetical protein
VFVLHIVDLTKCPQSVGKSFMEAGEWSPVLLGLAKEGPGGLGLAYRG